VKLINLKRLRKDRPDWQWSCERQGFGNLLYHGVKGQERVTVQAYSVLSGSTDDDFRTEWWVQAFGKQSQQNLSPKGSL